MEGQCHGAPFRGPRRGGFFVRGFPGGGGAAQHVGALREADRPSAAPTGWCGLVGRLVPDHDFQVGVDKELQVGVLLFIDRSGNFVTAGPPESRNAPEYYLAGHWTKFPDQTEISIDLARAAVKEFLASGGQRPTCVSWKNQYPDD
ncbi:Imm1 family immunity protein [Kitasatospora sp. NPDC087315]|uniref:Imm1 family immunity protein n=1 Tax=Kitasatospora sp. NPDC087315 TaxID=3364069 RepID=UPI0037FCE7E0